MKSARSSQRRDSTILPHSPLQLQRWRRVLWPLGVFSGVINLLMLTGSLFMLQVYDRVLPSRSLPTLAALLVIVALLFAFQTALEIVRNRIIVRLSRRLDEELSLEAFRFTVRRPLRPNAVGLPPDPLRDLERIRRFMSSMGPSALFDLPWTPLYVLICFLFHPALGWLTLGGAFVVSAVAVYGDRSAVQGARSVVEAAGQREGIVGSACRSAEVLATMNLEPRLAHRFARATVRFLDAHGGAVDRSNAIGAIVRGLRYLLQALVLALAALLAVRQEISAGTIIATSILSSRALAPIDSAVSNWRPLVEARQAWLRLKTALGSPIDPPIRTQLSAPRRELKVTAAAIGPPGARAPVVSEVSFSIGAGDGLGIIGPSGSGKTTLARGLTGIWPLLRGEVLLDGAPLDQYRASDLGSAIGYLPQEVELFDGTIAENIARFDPDCSDEAVIRAATLANVHDLVLKFPQGYDTVIGAGGLKLSAGQRQRIGLARALYGDPFLVILDEPYSNLDSHGDAALNLALNAVRARGGAFVMIAHRRSAIGAVNKLVVLVNGRQAVFGGKDEVLAVIDRVVQPDGSVQAPGSRPEFKVVSDVGR